MLNHITFSLYANGSEILETENRVQAIATAKTKADELQTTVTICENDESNGEQYEIMQVAPKPASHHLNIKFNAYTVTPTLAHPQAQPGLSGDVSTYRVVNIPGDVQASRVLYLFDHTAIVHPDKLPTPYTVEYRQLGVGRVIRSGVLIRADQVKPDMVFCCTSYPGAGIRTCHGSHLRQIGGDTNIVIDCGVGVSPLELSLSDELEVLGGAA